MTCVVAVKTAGGVIVAADSAAIDSDGSLSLRADKKIFKPQSDIVIGFTSSFRMGQVLQYSSKLPAPPADDSQLLRYMIAEFVPAARASLKEAGYATVSENVEQGGTFIVAIRSSVFCVYDDYQIEQPSSAYACVGCGASYALGSLHSTEKLLKNKSLQRAKLALLASQSLCSGVRAPFWVMSTLPRSKSAAKVR